MAAVKRHLRPGIRLRLAKGRVEPGGQGASVPFGADVGSRTGDDIQPGVPGEAEERPDVAVAVEEVLAPFRLVIVPRDVDVEGVVARLRHALDACGPQLLWHSKIEQAGAEQDPAPAVDPPAITGDAYTTLVHSGPSCVSAMIPL